MRKAISLIETLAILLIVSLLALVAASSITKWSGSLKVKNFAEKLVMDLQKARSLAYKLGESKVVINSSSYEIYAPTTKKLWEEKVPDGLSISSNESEITFKRNGLPNVNTTIEIEGYKTEYSITVSKISGRIQLEKLK
ncbi:MAG: type II secretion system protein [Desulfurobacteriaceae bacterium]